MLGVLGVIAGIIGVFAFNLFLAALWNSESRENKRGFK